MKNDLCIIYFNPCVDRTGIAEWMGPEMNLRPLWFAEFVEKAGHGTLVVNDPNLPEQWQALQQEMLRHHCALQKVWHVNMEKPAVFFRSEPTIYGS